MVIELCAGAEATERVTVARVAVRSKFQGPFHIDYPAAPTRAFAPIYVFGAGSRTTPPDDGTDGRSAGSSAGRSGGEAGGGAATTLAGTIVATVSPPPPSPPPLPAPPPSPLPPRSLWAQPPLHYHNDFHCRPNHDHHHRLSTVPPPGSHRVYAVGPGGVSSGLIKFTSQPRRAPSVPLSTVVARRGFFALFVFTPPGAMKI